MNPRPTTLGAAAALALLVAAGLTWWRLAPTVGGPNEADGPDARDTMHFPMPPAPPRLAAGDDYEKCLAMIANDPEGARSFADTWRAGGGAGGEGAEHCAGLAEVALGDADAGATILDRLAVHSGAPEVTRAMIFDQAAQAWMLAEEPARALGSAAEALALDPDDPDLLIDRATAQAALEHYHAAIADLDRALAIDPQRIAALVMRAGDWRHLEAYDRAGTDIDHALAIDPDYADALLERGILRQHAGDDPGARADWQRAMELAPNSAVGDLAEQNLALLDAGPERH